MGHLPAPQLHRPKSCQNSLMFGDTQNPNGQGFKFPKLYLLPKDGAALACGRVAPPRPAPRSFVPSVYHPVMEFLVFVFWLIINIYCTLLLSPGFLWGPRSTETLERGSGSCDQVAPRLLHCGLVGPGAAQRALLTFGETGHHREDCCPAWPKADPHGSPRSHHPPTRPADPSLPPGL